MTAARASVIAALENHAENRGQHPAISSDGTVVTYSELAAVVRACGQRLHGEGLRPGDVAGLTIADETRHLVVTLALLAIRVDQVTLATHDTALVRQQVAGTTRVTHTIDDAVARTLVPRPGEVQVASPAVTGDAPLGEAARILLRTSGTTSGLTIVALSDGQVAAQATRHGDYRDERLLRLASIEHNNSKRHRLYCVWAGGTNVFRPVAEHDTVAVCLRNEVTCLDISRIHAWDLVHLSGAAALSAVKVRTGGAAVPWNVRRAVLEKVTTELYVRYAATECGGIAMARPGEHDENETVGRPLPGVSVEVVDDDGRPLPPGESGHVRVRAPGMAAGYLGDPTASAQRFRDDWFHTGDLGHWQTDGSLVVESREDDVIIFNGLNIQPAEVERVLDAHPAVRASVALGLTSTAHGQIPVAVVEVYPHDTVSERDLMAHCRAALALRTPRRIVFVDQIPVSPQGKIRRADLAALFATARDENP